MQIVKYPDPILTKKAEPVEINKEVLDFVEELKVFLTKMPWGNPVGLAAPQVGKSWRIFVALGEAFINPEITWRPKGGDKHFIEGCYSLVDNQGYFVKRSYAIRLKFQDIAGEWHEERFVGLLAEIIQHEMDHLEGKLCHEAI